VKDTDRPLTVFSADALGVDEMLPGLRQQERIPATAFHELADDGFERPGKSLRERTGDIRDEPTDAHLVEALQLDALDTG
jgi:hypothetical protein